MSQSFAKYIVLSILMSISPWLSAHPGHFYENFTQGLASGFLHPLMGWDHLLLFAFLGVALVGMSKKSSAVLLMVFLSGLLIGYGVAYAGFHIFETLTIEHMIIFSAVCSGLCMLFLIFSHRFLTLYRSRLSYFFIAFFVIFSIPHGFVHGIEVSHDISVFGFGLGFLGAGLACVLVSHLWAFKMIGAHRKRDLQVISG